MFSVNSHSLQFVFNFLLLYLEFQLLFNLLSQLIMSQEHQLSCPNKVFLLSLLEIFLLHFIKFVLDLLINKILLFQLFSLSFNNMIFLLLDIFKLYPWLLLSQNVLLFNIFLGFFFFKFYIGNFYFFSNHFILFNLYFGIIELLFANFDFVLFSDR